MLCECVYTIHIPKIHSASYEMSYKLLVFYYKKYIGHLVHFVFSLCFTILYQDFPGLINTYIYARKHDTSFNLKPAP